MGFVKDKSYSVMVKLLAAGLLLCYRGKKRQATAGAAGINIKLDQMVAGPPSTTKYHNKKLAVKMQFE